MAREKTKELEILKAGAQVFCNKGFSNSSIQDIADCADVGKGTIYEYFKSKEELFICVTEFKHNEYIGDLQSALKKGNSFHDKLEKFFNYNQEIIQKNIQHIQLMILNELGALSDDAKNKLKKRMCTSRGKIIDILKGVFDLGRKEGKIREFNDDLISDIFLEMVIRTCIRFSQKELAGETLTKEDIEAEKKELLEFLFKGIGAISG